MFRNLRYLAGSISLATVLSLVLVSVQASAQVSGATLAVSQAHTSPTRSSLAGQVALRGRVLNANGLGVSGAMVYLYAWPAPKPIKQAPRVGTQVSLRFVGRAASSGTNGQYTVRISVPQALVASAAPNGIVNLQARVAGTGIGFYPFSLRIKPTTAGPVITTVSSPLVAVMRISSTAVHLAATPHDFCYIPHTSLIRNYKRAWGNIDATYMRRSGVQGWVNYEQTQDTNFSVGLSGSTKAGSFTSQGTFSFSATTGFDFTPNPGPSAESYQMQFVPSLFKTTYSPGTNCYVSYSVQPTEETGGNHVKYKIRIPRATHCVPEPSGAWHKSTTTASTISVGLTVAEIGFTASAQTGFSKTDTLSYQNIHGRHGYTLCGVHADPGANPGQIVEGRAR
jgi:hypothetical protein